MTALHFDWAGGAPLPGLSIPAEMATRFDLTPKEITAVLLGMKQRSDAFRIQRFVNAFDGEPLMAVLPGVALDDLWESLDIFERVLRGISLLVVLVGLSGLTATCSPDSTNGAANWPFSARSAPDRCTCLYCWPAKACSSRWPAHSPSLLLAAAAQGAQDWLLANLGVVLTTALPTPGEWPLLAAVVATGLLASLFPAWRAWRMSLADGLIPRQ